MIDVAMYFIFLYLLSYRAGLGLYRHGVTGCVLFALFLLHHAVNLRWYRGLGRGKYSLQRTLSVVMDFLLFAVMALMAASSVMMSGDVFPCSPFAATQPARNIHTLSASWGFLLTLFHMGLHTHAVFLKIHRKVKESFFAYAYQLLFLLALAVGIRCFWESGFLNDLLPAPHGSRAFEPLRFYGEYMMMTLAVCQISHLMLSRLNGAGNKKKPE